MTCQRKDARDDRVDAPVILHVEHRRAGLPRGVELYGRLNNFLNQKYEESFGFPALHLNFLAGIKFNFPAE